jgi:hypothetical protein
MAVRFFSKSSLVQGFPRNINFSNTIAFNANFLVIAGGGGGRNGVVNQYDGQGGHAQGYRASTGGTGYRGATAENSLPVITGANYTVTVGAGGPNSTSGSDSVFYTITSIGSPTGNAGGGGSGAGTGSAGGAGTANDITGTSVTRAGGGGGNVGAAYAGGGAGNSNGPGGNATPNTGSGGGGARSTSGTQPGGTGGSGIVFLQYPSERTITVGAGLTSSGTTTVGANKVTTLTGGTGTVSFA